MAERLGLKTTVFLKTGAASLAALAFAGCTVKAGGTQIEILPPGLPEGCYGGTLEAPDGAVAVDGRCLDGDNPEIDVFEAPSQTSSNLGSVATGAVLRNACLIEGDVTVRDATGTGSTRWVQFDLDLAVNEGHVVPKHGFPVEDLDTALVPEVWVDGSLLISDCRQTEALAD